MVAVSHAQFDQPAQVADYIAACEVLLPLVDCGKLDAAVDHIARTDARVLTGLARIGIADVMRRRRFAIRKKVKLGKPVQSPFKQLQAEEEDWCRLIGEIWGNRSDGTFRTVTELMLEYAASPLATWTLDNGSSLGEATVGYVRLLASHEERLSEGHLRNAAFYAAISAEHSDASVVREVVAPWDASAALAEVFGVA